MPPLKEMDVLSTALTPTAVSGVSAKTTVHTLYTSLMTDRIEYPFSVLVVNTEPGRVVGDACCHICSSTS